MGRGATDRRVAGATILLCAIVYAYTYTFDEVPAALMGGLGAELFPRLVLWTLAILAVLLALHVGSPPMDAPAPIPRPVWIAGGAMLLYVGVLELIGMWLASAMALVGLGWLWGERSLVKLSISAVMLTGALYLVFVRLLGGSFPRGLLGALVGP